MDWTRPTVGSRTRSGARVIGLEARRLKACIEGSRTPGLPPQMRRRLLQWLVCPHCREPLAAEAAQETGQEITEGSLSCAKCHRSFPIFRSIPRFVSSDNYASSFGRQWNRYARLQLDSQNGTQFSRERFYSI